MAGLNIEEEEMKKGDIEEEVDRYELCIVETEKNIKARAMKTKMTDV